MKKIKEKIVKFFDNDNKKANKDMKSEKEIREILSNILTADGYKFAHQLMIDEVAPENGVIVASVKARGVADDTDERGYVVSFGNLNMIKIIENNFKSFFELDEDELIILINLLKEELSKYMNVKESSINSFADKLISLYGLGKLPITFWYRKDGDKVLIKHPLITLANNVEGFGWLVPYLETVILQNMWLPTTVASNAERYFNIIEEFAKDTSNTTDMVSYQLHNFSARGATDTYSSVITDIAHRYYFNSTDAFYSHLMSDKVVLDLETKIKVPSTVYATEHSIMMMGGKDNECSTYEKLVTSLPLSDGIISLVIDTWNMDSFVRGLLSEDSSLVKAIKNRNKKTVFRPDSGNPMEVIFGSKDRVGLLPTLAEVFGTNEASAQTSSQQFKTLNNVGIIFGEGMSPQTVTDILQKAKELGFSSDNFVFGIGAYAYQYITRDTYGIAFKLVSHKAINEKNYYDLSKTPIDSEFKKELGGLYYDNDYDELIKVDRPSELTLRSSKFKKYVMS